MSENATEAAEGTEQAATETETPAQETDWKAMARKWEAQAKANKSAADELQQLRDAQKTDAEKAAERLAAAEKRAAELESKALRAEVAAEKGVPAKFLTGVSREELEASADELIEFRGASKPSGPKPDPSQGAKGKQGAGSTADQFAAFLNDQFTS